MNDHYIEQCKHGVVHSQCRCIGPKTVRIVACGPECARAHAERECRINPPVVVEETGDVYFMESDGSLGRKLRPPL